MTRRRSARAINRPSLSDLIAWEEYDDDYGEETVGASYTDQTHGPSRACNSKERKLPLPTAEEMIDVINKKCPNDEQDGSVKWFRANWTALVSNLVAWAKDVTIAQHHQWVYLTPKFREMSSANTFWLMRQGAEELIETYLKTIPLVVQKILSAPGATATDLLEFPTRALDSGRWAVYLDVPARLSSENILEVPAVGSLSNRVIKAIVPGTDQQAAFETQVYAVFTTSAQGAYLRVKQHLTSANPSTKVKRKTNETIFSYCFTNYALWHQVVGTCDVVFREVPCCLRQPRIG